MRYQVFIATGHPTEYRPLCGWDAIYPSRAKAEEAAERARSQSGWEARVIKLDDTDGDPARGFAGGHLDD
jgi:hypothetical protein